MSQQSPVYSAKVTAVEDLNNDEAKWLKLSLVHWTDPNGTARTFERVTRRTRQPGLAVDATGVFPIMVWPSSSDSTTPFAAPTDAALTAAAAAGLLPADDGTLYPRIVLIKQFRPTTGAVSIEMPAGLVDPAEDPNAAGIREVKEETGYLCEPLPDWPVPVSCTDAGIGGSMLHSLFAKIDMSRPENQAPAQELDGEEFIDVFSLPLAHLKAALDYLTGSVPSTGVDSRLSAFAEGFELASRLHRFT